MVRMFVYEYKHLCIYEFAVCQALYVSFGVMKLVRPRGASEKKNKLIQMPREKITFAEQ